MVDSLPGRLAEAFMSPLGTAVLALAFLGIMTTIAWAFWDKRRAAKASDASYEPMNAVPPPLVQNTLMRGGEAGDGKPAKGGGDGIIKSVLIGMALVVAVMLGIQVLMAPKPAPSADEPADGADEGTEIADGTSAQTPQGPQYDCQTGWVTVPHSVDGKMPAPGTTAEPIKSYKLCDGRQAAYFDLLSFEADDKPVLHPYWYNTVDAALGTEGDKYYKKPKFRLSADEFDIIPVAGMKEQNMSYKDNYDAYVSVGLAGFDVANDTARRLAESRAFHVARFVTSELEGDKPQTSCRKPVQVIAVSVGQYQGGGRYAAAEEPDSARRKAWGKGETFKQEPARPEPVLLGVRFDKDTLPADYDVEELIRMFVRSEGGDIATFHLGTFEPVDILFDNKVCVASEADDEDKAEADEAI